MAKVTKASLDELHQDLANLNKHAERGSALTRKSIERFGARLAGVVDKHNRIIDGNDRQIAFGEVDLNEIEIVEADPNKPVYLKFNDLDLADPDNPARELQVALHRSAVESFAIDAENLLTHLNEGLDVKQWFNQEELDALLDGLIEKEPMQPAEAQIDKAAELQKLWNTQTGQLWQLGRHRLICGDCTDKATVERLMQGERAALAWFDPPFGINLQPQRGLTEAIENDGQQEAKVLWAKFLPILHSVMVDNSHVFLCQNWKEFDWTLPLIKQYFTLKSKVIWNKNVWGLGYFTRPKHEDIIYCWKGEPATIAEPVADVWDVARESAPDHAAEKPPELSAIAIEHFSAKDDIVIDWFSGVGGSIIACEQLGRKSRSMEINPGFVAITLQRYKDSTNIEPVLIDTGDK